MLKTVLAYTLIAIVFTYPLITKIATSGFGFDEDSPYQIWHNWWLKFSLFDLKQSPLWTDYIFHPQKIPLIYDANSFVFGALTLPLQLLVSVLTASNIIFLLSFVLSGLSMFALAFYVLQTRLPSFFAGAIFAFSPYTLAQAMDGHTNLITTWIIPLYTLFLIKALDRRLGNKKFEFRISNFEIISGLLAALQLYSDFTYTAFLIVETILIITYHFLRIVIHRRIGQSARYSLVRIVISMTIIGLTAAVIASPILLEVVKASRSGFRVGSSLWVQNEWAADLRSYLFPNDRSTLFRNLAYTPPRGTVEGTVFLGYAVSALFLLTLIFNFSKKNFASSTPLRAVARPTLWIFLALSFFLLSLGPALHYNGKFQFNFLILKDVIFPLPFTILHKFPLVGEIQEPTRINPFLSLSVAMTVAYLLDHLLCCVRRERMKKILVSAVVLIALAEYLPLPFPITDLRPPEIYKTIAADKGNFSVLALPLGFNSGNVALGKSPIGSLQYFQVIHKHPSFRGTVARLPSASFDYFRKLPLVKYLIDPSKVPDEEDQDSTKAYAVIKSQLNVKYIVIHKDKYEGGTYKNIQKTLSKTLPLEFISEDEKTISYKLK